MDKSETANLPDIGILWERLRALKFPRDTSWREVPDGHLLLTDTYASGCIATFLEQQPNSLDTKRIQSLEGCRSKLDMALASGILKHDSLEYFSLLREVVVRVLAEVSPNK